MNVGDLPHQMENMIAEVQKNQSAHLFSRLCFRVCQSPSCIVIPHLTCPGMLRTVCATPRPRPERFAPLTLQMYPTYPSPQLRSHARPFPDLRDAHAPVWLPVNRHPVQPRSRVQAGVESVAAPLVRADAPNIEEPVNAVCSGMAILRRIGCPERLGAAGVFPRRWRAL